ncbi:MAG: hypothetical protein CAF45_010705 [Nitrospira sp. CG24E]|nr:MAG: hypothetical protein CAF45_010705 [Nitrospira sp. CG24E]
MGAATVLTVKRVEAVPSASASHEGLPCPSSTQEIAKLAFSTHIERALSPCALREQGISTGVIPSLHRARSANKKDHLAASAHPILPL